MQFGGTMLDIPHTGAEPMGALTAVALVQIPDAVVQPFVLMPELFDLLLGCCLFSFQFGNGFLLGHRLSSFK